MGFISLDVAAAGTDGENVELSIIVLNYRTMAEVIETVRAASRVCASIAHEVIVVDNASSDDTALAIREGCPNARLIALPANVGFAAGMNAGIREAIGEYVLLLNSDIAAQPDSIELMLGFVRSNPDVGLCAPRLIDQNGRDSRTLLTQPTIARVLVPWVGKFAYNKWRGRLGPEPLDVEVTEGAAVMVSRLALETAGPLDEDFFFYHEIVEWCLRIRDRGFRVCIVPGATMEHACGGSTGKVRKAARIELKRSEYQLLAKRLGRWFATTVKARDLIGEACSVVFYGLLCALSMGQWKRGRDKFVVHSGVLRWILIGMPGRQRKSYIRLFGSWD